MKQQVLDIQGNKVEELELSENIFGIKPNETVLAQYVRVFLANQRQGTSSTKTRAEVSGGGKKPWRQKGTGRARHGSTRSPIWRHGGVAHGPKPKSWSLSLPQKIRQLALKSALSQKQANDKIKILCELETNTPSTKFMREVLTKLESNGKTLIVLDTVKPNVIKSSSNLPAVNTVFWEALNAYDILSTDTLIFTKDAVLKLQEKYEAK